MFKCLRIRKEAEKETKTKSERERRDDETEMLKDERMWNKRGSERGRKWGRKVRGRQQRNSPIPGEGQSLKVSKLGSELSLHLLLKQRT